MMFYLNVSRMLSVKEQIIKTASFLWDLETMELNTAVVLFISCISNVVYTDNCEV